MKPLLVVGLLLLILGIASFFVQIPHMENHGISVGGASVGVTTKTHQSVPPVLSVLMIAGGIVLMVAGARK